MVNSSKRVTAAVLIIGNEILSGRTQDTNLAYLARKLNEYGIQIREARVVPDIEAEIVDAVNALRSRFDYVFTTGGIGPTHDDITAECIAAAFGVPLVVNEEIAEILRRRPSPPDIMESRMRMARIPEGGGLIRNPFGPHGFYIDNVYVMAGIPRVMQAMIDNAHVHTAHARLVERFLETLVDIPDLAVDIVVAAHRADRHTDRGQSREEGRQQAAGQA